MVRYRKTYEVVGYTADADMWCKPCLLKAGYATDGKARDGNDVHPVFLDQCEDEDCCGCCGERLK